MDYSAISGLLSAVFTCLVHLPVAMRTSKAIWIWHVNDLYTGVFARTYGFNTIGLRYFNVFGSRQDPNGAYAAVIPKWIYPA